MLAVKTPLTRSATLIVDGACDEQFAALRDRQADGGRAAA
jgi:hypothetical protein